MNDIGWSVIQELTPLWCDKPCLIREGCGCADVITRALLRAQKPDTGTDVDEDIVERLVARFQGAPTRHED